MFHFNGTFLDLFYASFFVIGIGVVSFFVFVLIAALIIGLIEKKKKAKDMKTVLDLLSQDKRKERIEQMIEQSREELANLEKELEKNTQKEDKNGNTEETK